MILRYYAARMVPLYKGWHLPLLATTTCRALRQGFGTSNIRLFATSTQHHYDLLSVEVVDRLDPRPDHNGALANPARPQSYSRLTSPNIRRSKTRSRSRSRSRSVAPAQAAVASSSKPGASTAHVQMSDSREVVLPLVLSPSVEGRHGQLATTSSSSASQAGADLGRSRSRGRSQATRTAINAPRTPVSTSYSDDSDTDVCSDVCTARLHHTD